MAVDRQVIIVTGGTRGLGGALVDRLLEKGHAVSTCGRSRTPLVDQWEAAHADSGRFHFAAVDLSRAESIPDYVRQVHDRFGRIDVLINNAAIAHDGVLALETEDRIAQMLQVNLQAAVLMAKHCSRWMLVQRHGVIINVSSIIAQRGFSGLAVYASTKSALEGLTRALAREMGARGIRVNAIAPGYLDTEMSASLEGAQRQQIIRRTPLGRLGTVDDVVPCVEFLISPGAGFITGQVITIDGGSTV
ncbi:MAG: SDR family oxidoreductase [Pirellulales bacterium]